MPKSTPPATRAETPSAKKRARSGDADRQALLSQLVVDLHGLDTFLRNDRRETSKRLEAIEQRLEQLERNRKGAA